MVAVIISTHAPFQVTKDVLRYTLLILYKCGMEVPLSSDQKSATECREFFGMVHVYAPIV